MFFLKVFILINNQLLSTVNAKNFDTDYWRTDNSATDNSDNSAKSIQTIQPETIQPVLQNAKFERKKSELELFLGLRSTVGALRARRRDNRL